MKDQSSILVIDDEQIICDSCNRILTKEDYKELAEYEKDLANEKKKNKNKLNKWLFILILLGVAVAFVVLKMYFYYFPRGFWFCV
jgi:DNA-binding NtrC family response regulator